MSRTENIDAARAGAGRSSRLPDIAFPQCSLDVTISKMQKLEPSKAPILVFIFAMPAMAGQVVGRRLQDIYLQKRL